jgi:hypothetical protein
VFIDRLDAISRENELDFVVSVSADPEEIADIVENHEVLN